MEVDSGVSQGIKKKVYDLLSNSEGLTSKEVARELGISYGTAYSILTRLTKAKYLKRIVSKRRVSIDGAGSVNMKHVLFAVKPSDKK